MKYNFSLFLTIFNIILHIMIEQHLILSKKEDYQNQLKNIIENVINNSLSNKKEICVGILIESFSSRYKEVSDVIAELLSERCVDFIFNRPSKTFTLNLRNGKNDKIKILSAMNPAGLRGIGFTDLIVIGCDNTKTFSSNDFEKTIVPAMLCRVNTSITYIHDYIENAEPKLIISSKKIIPIPY